MKQQLRYVFNHIATCDMCGHPATDSKILGQRLNQSQGRSPRDKIGIAVSVLQCARCSLIYSNPQPMPFDMQDHYGIPPEDYWDEPYFTYSDDYFSHHISWAKKLLPFQPDMPALDIGAGLGKCMISLEKAGFDAYGIEPSMTFREKAITKMKIDESRLKLGMLEEVEYPANSFDFISFGAVLEHLVSPSLSIERALEWLKPNGVILIEVPSAHWFIPKIFNQYYRLRGTNYVTHLSPMHRPFHLYEFTPQSFEALAKRLNFEIAHLEFHVCTIYHMPKALHRSLRWYMKKTNTGMLFDIWLRKK